MCTAAQTRLFGSSVAVENSCFLFCSTCGLALLHSKTPCGIYTSHDLRTVRHTHCPADPPDTHSGGCVCLHMDKTWSVWQADQQSMVLALSRSSQACRPPRPFSSFPSWTHLYQLLKHDSLSCFCLLWSPVTLVCQVFCQPWFFYKLTGAWHKNGGCILYTILPATTADPYWRFSLCCKHYLFTQMVWTLPCRAKRIIACWDTSTYRCVFQLLLTLKATWTTPTFNSSCCFSEMGYSKCSCWAIFIF